MTLNSQMLHDSPSDPLRSVSDSAQTELAFEGDSIARPDAVAVAVACYNQADYLDEALRSVMQQTVPPDEIILVDDGSTDQTREVARRWPQVRYIHQVNQGLSSARNTGWHAASSPWIVFLDADDRLLPEALQAGLACLARYPQAAFVSGHYQFVDQQGSVLPTWRELHQGDDRTFTSGDFQLFHPDGSPGSRSRRPAVSSDHYSAMLRRNYIGMHATVMYRRAIFEEVGGFDTSLPCCEDYEMYLRITRKYPVACHDAVIAQYRRHRGGMSGRTLRMLSTALRVLDRQRGHLSGDSCCQNALREGEQFWIDFYSRQLARDIPRQLRTGQWSDVAASGWWLCKLLCGIRPRPHGRRPT
jgi:GT2 family glycosyltransferase